MSEREAADRRPTGTGDCLPADDAAAACPECGRPFVTEDHRVLHRGLSHPDALDDADREAFESAYRAESDELRLVQIRAIGAFVVVYFVFLLTYFVVT